MTLVFTSDVTWPAYGERKAAWVVVTAHLFFMLITTGLHLATAW